VAALQPAQEKKQQELPTGWMAAAPIPPGKETNLTVKEANDFKLAILVKCKNMQNTSLPEGRKQT